MGFARLVALGLIFAFVGWLPDRNPPRAPEKSHEITQAGHVWNDPFFWLRERDDPAVLKYLEAENAHTDRVMKPTVQLQDDLYKEMRGRIKEEDMSVPVKIDDYYYYSRTETGKQYQIHCR